MKTKLVLLLALLSLVQCTTTDRHPTAADAERSPSGAPIATFEAYLRRIGMNVYYANLHAHHYMEHRSGKKSPYPPGFLGPGKCDDKMTFPQDDGRPCRADASGENMFVVPPSAASGNLDRLDYFRLACDFAKTDGGLDILMVTPHSKNGEGDGDADTELQGYIDRHKELAKINQNYRGEFYCGLGQEASSISKGNHVNIMGHMRAASASTTEPYFFPSGAFDKFYPQVKERRAKGEQVILQFNHPDVGGDMFWGELPNEEQIKADKKIQKKMKEALNDYGIDDFAPIGCLLPGGSKKAACANTPAAGPLVTSEVLRQTFGNIIKAGGDAYRLAEVTEVGGATTNFEKTFRPSHKRKSTEEAQSRIDDGLFAYIFFLNMGFKVGPTANQDNHFMNYGSAIASRTGVIAKSLSEDDVFEALDKRLVFATEDRNAKLLFGTRADGKDVMMGEDVTVKGDEITLAAGYHDLDDAGPVDVRVYYYHESDNLTFDRKANRLGAIRTVQFTEAGPQIPAGPAEPSELKAWLTSGQVRSLRLPLKKGRTIIFLEYTQADHDKIWSSPLFVNSI